MVLSIAAHEQLPDGLHRSLYSGSVYDTALQCFADEAEYNEEENRNEQCDRKADPSKNISHNT